MNTAAPLVLVLARYREPREAARLQESLARQTYPNCRLVFVQRNEKELPAPSANPTEVCLERNLIAELEKSGADRVFFWPDDVDLKPAAIEKLVLALQTAPDQDGVADAEHGSTGLWLARVGEGMTALIALWLTSHIDWIAECQRRKPSLFFIPENLIQDVDPMSLRRPYAVEHLFGKLAPRFESYQPITAEPLWTIPAEEPDDRSVLFLVSSLPIGGACKFILDITGQLKAQGYRVTIATTAYGANHPWLDALLEIVPDVFVLSHARPVELPRLIVHLARTRRCSRVVVSHSMLGYQLLPLLRAELPGVRFLDYTHIEYETEWPNGGYARRSVENQPLLDLSLVSSRHLRDWMTTRGAEEKAIRVCHTNIDTDKWAPNPEARERERKSLGLDRKTTVILYPCRITEQKRPELMCNIVAALRRATKAPFVVLVAGDGPLMPELEKFIEKHGLTDFFRLLGAVSLERVAQLHNASDIFLLPSLIEGIALALFEAMALESVPVVSDVGGQRELVTAECGHLIPLGEPAREVTAYVAALKALVENPDRRRQLASAGRARVRDHFHLRQMTATFIAALEESGRPENRRDAQLPAPSICRELATLAIDAVRLTYEGRVRDDMNVLLQDRLTKQEKIIQKLRRQTEAAQWANPVEEDNEIHC